MSTILPIDAPMLPQRHPYTSSSLNCIPLHSTSLVPLVTPPCGSRTDHDDSETDTSSNQLFLLVPNPQNVVVRSLHHGRRVAVLSPERKAPIIAVTLAWMPHEEHQQGEWIILVACHDGSLHEWTVASLSRQRIERKPRRSFQIQAKNGNILHMTSPFSTNDTDWKRCAQTSEGSLLFAIITEREKHRRECTSFVQWLIPSWDNATYDAPISLEFTVLARVQKKKDSTDINSNNVIRLKKRDAIFGFVAFYRPAISKNTRGGMDYLTERTTEEKGDAHGDIFVVLCASRSLFVFQKSHPSQTVREEKFFPIVQFDSSPTLSINPATVENTNFLSVAISPDGKDMALGRYNGHIDVFRNVFDNVAEYLEKSRQQHQHAAHQVENIPHPNHITVRRDLHWHSHPVLALTFLTPAGKHDRYLSSTLATNLVSGGEESVLATWQLERNFHRPTHFVARVGQGSILHTLCCPYSGAIIVSCADNSIHSYSGSNYVRNWVEQGLASIPLHEKDAPSPNETSHTLNNRPILMLMDPITNIPILTNLPGAPGMIHWYDPKSSSVAAILEVAPYNRISRKDPTNDPPIPAPSVTHMAIGQDGKDLVTVDIVWTENMSVGIDCNLVGPKGDSFPMNTCTSIKFWRYNPSKRDSLSRKRSQGDIPRDYDLVSCMVAPHGRHSTVCALALRRKGDIACTLSQEENAFRVWVKKEDSLKLSVGSTLWKCLYKVKTPCGFSNMLSTKETPSSGEHLVSFSLDGTVLSVCYGSVVTLWDHSDATLLTSLMMDGRADVSEPNRDIEQVHFLTQRDDTILLTNASQICVKSPFCGFGNGCYLGNDEWTCDIDLLGDGAMVLSAVVPLNDIERGIGTNGLFAVAISVQNGKRTIVTIINRENGAVACTDGSAIDNFMQWELPGTVQSLCLSDCSGPYLELLAITNDFKIMALRCDFLGEIMEEVAEKAKANLVRTGYDTKAPVLKIQSEKTELSVKRRKISIVTPQRSEEVRKYSAFDFPVLSGKFTSAYITKCLDQNR